MAPRFQEELALQRRHHGKRAIEVPIPVSITDEEHQVLQDYCLDFNARDTALRTGWPATKVRRLVAREDGAEVIARISGQRVVSEANSKHFLIENCLETIRADPSHLLDENDHFLPFKKVPAGTRRAIQEFSAFDGPEGVRLIKVRLEPKAKARETLGRIHALFVDKMQIDHVHSIIPPEVISLLSTNEIAEVRQAAHFIQTIVAGAQQRAADMAARRA